MEFTISEKKHLEDEIEKSQKLIWICEIEIRTINRLKLDIGADGFLRAEDQLKILKAKADYEKKKLEVLKDRWEELTKEKIKINFN